MVPIIKGYITYPSPRYVHANNRFIVDPRADYKAQSADADIHIDWDNVLQILVSPQSQLVLSFQSQPLIHSESRLVVCPICLQAPVAPRMTKCGHIFCLSCLVAYMAATSDEANKPYDRRPKWKKCPVCVDSIYLSDIRPVRWYTGRHGEPPIPGGDIVLRLIRRGADSTLALPRDATRTLQSDEQIPWYHAAEVMDYARVMKGGRDYMIEQFDAEIQDVQQREKEDELIYGDGDEWTRKAVRYINEAKEKVKPISNPPSLRQARNKQPPHLKYDGGSEDVPDMYAIQQEMQIGQSGSTGDRLSTPSEKAVPGSPHPQETVVKGKSPAETIMPVSRLSSQLTQQSLGQKAEQPVEYYFYQALPHYYLSSLDIRILKAAYGSYSAFPVTILPKVEHVSPDHQVDDALRRRVRYLDHLPYGCEVSFLECDWTDTIDASILEKFKPEIERRRKRNQDKEAREEKERIRAEKEEDERYAAARRKRLSPPAERFHADDFQPLMSFDTTETDPSSSSPPWPRTIRQGSAFASLASPSTSPSSSRTVWGTAAIPPASPQMDAVPEDDQELNNDDGWLQGWEDDVFKEDELIAQVAAVSLGKASKNNLPTATKKKKSKKITLMTTNARRGA